ncbi:NAD(P)H-quinone oxidoreductase [Corynebacterium marinum]|uniref:Quinone oxidoreductase n=1 Tax=Corynebacterium marinum DSM 44953 TaxID=1224162 RepID=A0A0B6TIP0_9CORY|nr:NAD(P)H-quinone oxidoreductase [Corynebacterium marinum]AJK67808.1 quinone oxidoreductase [Corynebacterium marinum DSM 44953]GGO12276.1 NADPH:quinone oxidoreductase [Corynebacterium marinum]
MKAIQLTNPEDPRSLVLVDTDLPQLRDGEVLVKVHAAGVNRGDLLQARGHYPPPPGASDIIGLECSGVIEDPGATGRKAGEEVACLLAGGGYAEYVAVPEGQLMPIPAGYSLTEAASVVEAACTVWSNLGMLAGVRAGQTVLIHGGAGGIGTFAIQLCRQLGATVAVTAGSAEKLEVCRELGADILINYREQDFAEELKGRCDVILDIIGAKYLRQNLRALAEDGQLVIIGLQGGVKTEINLGALLPRRLSVRGTTLRARSLAGKAEVVASTVEHVWPMLSDARIAHRIHAVLPLAEAAKAHDLLDSGEVTGKIVLEA